MPARPCSASLTSVLRMAFGGHFFTDVAAAGLVTFLVIWLVHGYIYRWPSTRMTDARDRRRADAVRLAGYRLRAAMAGLRCRPQSSRRNGPPGLSVCGRLREGPFRL